MVRTVLGPLDARSDGTTYDVWLAVMGLPRVDDMLDELRWDALVNAGPRFEDEVVAFVDADGNIRDWCCPNCGLMV